MLAPVTGRSRPVVLVVDDEADILDFLERALRRGFEVRRFCDPLAALAELDATAFDLLITDQKMPGLTGLDLAARVAARSPRTARLLISGYTEVPEIAEALASARIHNFVLKPVDSHRLLEAIETAARRASDLTPASA